MKTGERLSSLTESLYVVIVVVVAVVVVASTKTKYGFQLKKVLEIRFKVFFLC